MVPSSLRNAGTFRHRSLVVTILVSLTVLAGCRSEPETRSVRVRGLYVGPQFDGLVAVIDHEDIPGIMGAMRMGFRLEDPAELASIPKGSPIVFDLVMQGDEWYIRRLEVLPDSTRLVLEPDTAATHHPMP